MPLFGFRGDRLGFFTRERLVDRSQIAAHELMQRVQLHVQLGGELFERGVGLVSRLRVGGLDDLAEVGDLVIQLDGKIEWVLRAAVFHLIDRFFNIGEFLAEGSARWVCAGFLHTVVELVA